MRLLASSVVDGKTLLKVIVSSLVAGVGVSTVFGIAIVGAVRFVDMRRDGRGPEAVFFAVLALAGVAVSLAAVGYGIYLMAKK
jgi:uncharacterized membrane protein